MEEKTSLSTVGVSLVLFNLVKIAKNVLMLAGLYSTLLLWSQTLTHLLC